MFEWAFVFEVWKAAIVWLICLSPLIGIKVVLNFLAEEDDVLGCIVRALQFCLSFFVLTPAYVYYMIWWLGK